MQHGNTTKFIDLNTLSCPDRMVITGSSIDIGHEDAMRLFFRIHGIHEDSMTAWAKPITDRLYLHAEELSKSLGLPIVDCNIFKGRKDDYVRQLLRKKRPDTTTVICLFKSMETCRAPYRFKRKQLKEKGSPFYMRNTKCLHFYIYIYDPILGLVSIRYQTYAPFTIQVIINGHDVLQHMLDKNNIKYSKRDNCYTYISDFKTAQELANTITGKNLYEQLQRIVNNFIPLQDKLPSGYRLSVRQVEFSTDVYLSKRCCASDKFHGLLQQLSLHNPNEILLYTHQLVRKPKDPRGSIRQNHLGTCVKFHNGPNSIKAYHKEPHIIRIETTSYNLTKISAWRTIRSRNGNTYVARRPMARSLYDVNVFFKWARHANQRLSRRIGCIWDRTNTPTKLNQITQKTQIGNSSFRGFNFFSHTDSSIFNAVLKPAFDLTGFKRSNLMESIPTLTAHQASYALKRLLAHKLIKKEVRSHRYTITNLGRSTGIAMVAIRHLFILPILAA
jgi:hypothetical protein